MTFRDFLPALPDKRSAIAGAVLIVAACLLAYAPSLRNDFVMWDDPLVLYSNPIAKGITPHNLKAAFTTYDPELYVPLTVLSYQIEYTIAGRSPFIYHFDNLLLHAANAVFVTLLLFRLLRSRGIALFLGLVFALHPVNVESVAWASARKDVLCTFFFLLSALSYLRYREDGSAPAYWASVGLLFLSLMSKVSMVTAPVLFLLFDVFERRERNRNMILDKLPHLLLAVVFIAIALFGKTDALGATTTLQKILMACKSTVFYLQSFLVPWNLSPLYPYVGEIRIGLAAFWLPLLLFLALAGAVACLARRLPILPIAAGFYFAALFPTFANFDKGEFYIASDRYLYVPMLGLLLLAGWAAVRLRERHAAAWHRFAPSAAALLLLVYAGLTVRQSLFWKDSDTLMSYAVRVQPTAVAGWTNLALVDTAKGRYDAALAHLDAANAIRPDSLKVLTGRANVYAKMGRMDEAIAQCAKAVELEPKNFEPHYCLAQAYHVNGDFQRALDEYRLIVELEPQHVGALTNIGSILLDRGEIDAAEKAFRAALAVDNTFGAGHFNMGVLQELRNKYPEALAEFELAARYDLYNEEPLRHIVALSKELGDLKKATSAAERIAWLRRNAPTDENAILESDGLALSIR